MIGNIRLSLCPHRRQDAKAWRCASSSVGRSRCAHRPRPPRGAYARRLTAVARLEPCELPRRLERLDIRPDPGSEPGETGGAKRRRFNLLGALHRNAQYIGLKLHQPIILRRTPVDPERGALPGRKSAGSIPGARSHDVENVSR